MSFLAFYSNLNFFFFLGFCPFLFSLYLVSLCVFTPVQQSTAWPPMLMSLFSVTGVTTLFMDQREGYPWCL